MTTVLPTVITCDAAAVAIDKRIDSAALTESAGHGRKLRHRHIVAGHFQDYLCGPGRTRRECHWIEPYWRGPEDAPYRDHDYEAL